MARRENQVFCYCTSSPQADLPSPSRAIISPIMMTLLSVIRCSSDCRASKLHLLPQHLQQRLSLLSQILYIILPPSPSVHLPYCNQNCSNFLDGGARQAHSFQDPEISADP